MRLTILGGGGFRTPLVYEAVARRATGLVVDEVVLHDVDATRLATMQQVIDEMGQAIPTTTRVRATTDLREAATDADFIFSAVRVGGARGRTVDERVALDLGLLGQETIGPGGLAYALRTIPVMNEIARTIAEVAPQAWTINFTNPVGIVTEAMRDVLGERVIGICDTPIGLVERVSRTLGIPLRQIEFDYIGLNHMGWLRSAVSDGQDQLSRLLDDDALLEHIEEARMIGFDWVRQQRVLPNEYLFYYLFTDEAVRRIAGTERTRGEFLLSQQSDFYQSIGCCQSPLHTWREALHQREATYMAESRDEERREEDIAGGGYQEVALRLMTALAQGTPERMILNVSNGTDHGRIVPELPDDLCIEVPCVADAAGIHPQQVAPLTLGQLGMIARLRASERCIKQAALTGDADLAWEGFSTHPLVNSPTAGRKLLDGYVAGHPELADLFHS